jgi:hypothetical protein
MTYNSVIVVFILIVPKIDKQTFIPPRGRPWPLLVEESVKGS